MCGSRRDDTQKKIICERLVNECIVGGDGLRCHGIPAGRLELPSHQLRKKAGKDSDREVSSQRLFTASLLNERDQQDEQTKSMEARRVLRKAVS